MDKKRLDKINQTIIAGKRKKGLTKINPLSKTTERKDIKPPSKKILPEWALKFEHEEDV